MSKYVDGFVLPLPKDKIEPYRAIAEKASKIWREHGALEYRECILEDPAARDMLPFPQLAAAQANETVVLAYITYHSREHRDEVNGKVMADSRMHGLCEPNESPFDWTRMAFGGFQTIVEA
jgi:uncharacterized protein YbaA (DUF1428 family)